jgi:hypothetical protein
MICVILVISQYAIYTAIANTIRGIVSQSTCTISLCSPTFLTVLFVCDHFVQNACTFLGISKGVDNPRGQAARTFTQIKSPDSRRGQA